MILRPFQEFTKIEASGGILLLLATAAALVWVNSPWDASYTELWSTRATLGISDFALNKPLFLWVNDGLMAVFFFVVGLEIKREVLLGELSSIRAASLPIAAAIGGIAAPALIFTAINATGPTPEGWAIPMATDIAFALGVLALLGTRAPLSLKIFLTAVAIVDDLGAILVIAFFFSENIGFVSLGAAAGFIALLIGANKAGFRNPIVYFLLSCGLWVAFLKSGIHPTLAGVVAAMAIPATTLVDKRQFAERVRGYINSFEETIGLGSASAKRERQHAVHAVEAITHQVQSPLARLEHTLHPWVAFAIMPLFALANAGVVIGKDFGEALTSPLTLGVIAGLAIGKPLGIVGATWLAVRLGVATMPPGLNWTRIAGAAMLAGIGFTMSLFIAGLAFDDPGIVEQAKAGILVASVIAGIAGFTLLYRAGSPLNKTDR